MSMPNTIREVHMPYGVEQIYCAEPGCQESFKNHYWGRVKTEGWFHQKDGHSWCPAHLPSWVEDWRSRRRPKQ